MVNFLYYVDLNLIEKGSVHINQLTSIESPEINPMIKFFTWVTRWFNRERIAFSADGAETPGEPHIKEGI